MPYYIRDPKRGHNFDNYPSGVVACSSSGESGLLALGFTKLYFQIFFRLGVEKGANTLQNRETPSSAPDFPVDSGGHNIGALKRP